MYQDENELDGSRAPFLEHLEELRWRLFRAILGVTVGVLVCFAFSEILYDFFTAPLYAVLEANRDVLGDDAKLVSRTVAGAFMFHFKTAIIGGIFVGIPVVLYQIWQFVVPGLYQHERKLALPFVVISSACFIGGGLFAYYLVLPAIFDFLITYSIKTGPNKLIPEIAIEDYLGITTKLLLAFGIVFEMPVLAAFLSWIGLITHRTLLGFFRWAVVIAFILGAMLTPPDIISQMFLAGPLVVLYLLSIAIAYVITMRHERFGSDDDDPESPDADEAPDGAEDEGPTDASETPKGSMDSASEGTGQPSEQPQDDASRTLADRQLQMPFQGDDEQPPDEPDQ